MAARLPKAFVSWSSGKDSAYALLEARRQSIAEIVGIITTIDTADDRVAIHGVRQGLLTRQAPRSDFRSSACSFHTPAPMRFTKPNS